MPLIAGVLGELHDKSTLANTGFASYQDHLPPRRIGERQQIC
jgi:hypothetical protein